MSLVAEKSIRTDEGHRTGAVGPLDSEYEPTTNNRDTSLAPPGMQTDSPLEFQVPTEIKGKRHI